MPQYYIFSDESGSWHDNKTVYVRSWIVILKEEYEKKVVNRVDEISSILDADEIKWSNVSGGAFLKFLNDFSEVNFKIFITVTKPQDIAWDSKYRINTNFERSIELFDFGNIEIDLKNYIKDRFRREIKNALFLNYYEKLHIHNAKEGIERIIRPNEYELIYRIDPPQLPRGEWQNILNDGETNVSDFEFESSERSQGIQFADVFAGAFRSYFEQDRKYESAFIFIRNFRSNLIPRSATNPNPNLIMFGETHNDLKQKCREIWH
jgi:hypothetical protein